MLALSFVLSLLAVATSAAPALDSRQALSPCELSFGPGGVDTYYNLTFAAVNKTLPNANATGAPLVLGITYDAGAQLYNALATYESYPHYDWDAFSLINGTLYPYDNAESQDYAISLPVASGQELGFEISSESNGLPAPTSPYCLIAGDDPSGHNPPYPILAVNGDQDNFSLCVSYPITGSPIVVNMVVYNASDSTSADRSSYNYSTCYGVTVQAIPLSG